MLLAEKQGPGARACVASNVHMLTAIPTTTAWGTFVAVSTTPAAAVTTAAAAATVAATVAVATTTFPVVGETARVATITLALWERSVHGVGQNM